MLHSTDHSLMFSQAIPLENKVILHVQWVQVAGARSSNSESFQTVLAGLRSRIAI